MIVQGEMIILTSGCQALALFERQLCCEKWEREREREREVASHHAISQPGLQCIGVEVAELYYAGVLESSYLLIRLMMTGRLSSYFLLLSSVWSCYWPSHRYKQGGEWQSSHSVLSSFEFQRLPQSPVRPGQPGREREAPGAITRREVRAGGEVVGGRCLRGSVDVVA